MPPTLYRHQGTQPRDLDLQLLDLIILSPWARPKLDKRERSSAAFLDLIRLQR